MAETADEIEQRLMRGEWLMAGAVATLFGVSRASVKRWIIAGKTPNEQRLRHRELPSGYRECHPDDVRAILQSYRDVREEGRDKPST